MVLISSGSPSRSGAGLPQRRHRHQAAADRGAGAVPAQTTLHAETLRGQAHGAAHADQAHAGGA